MTTGVAVMTRAPEFPGHGKTRLVGGRLDATWVVRLSAAMLEDTLVLKTPEVQAESIARDRAAGFSVRIASEGFDVDEPYDLVAIPALLAVEPVSAPRTARFLLQDPR